MNAATYTTNVIDDNSPSKRFMRALRVILLRMIAVLSFAIFASLGFCEEENAASWKTPSSDAVKKASFDWINAKAPSPETLKRAEAIWSDMPKQATEDDSLNRVVAVFALSDKDAQTLQAVTERPPQSLVPPKFALLTDPKAPSFVTDNLRLRYARWLAQHEYYDEAQELLKGLTPDRVVAPASLLFYQGVVAHRLLEKESGVKTLDLLLESDSVAPRRYSALARALRADLENLDEDSLDHVARRMDDVRRRLELGRVGPKTVTTEKGVVQSLDKMIKDLEEKSKQCDKSQGQSTLRPDKPSEESKIAEGKGAGEVTKKNVGEQAGWGDLPPRQREEAMQQIGRDFPAQYRDAIEQYFKKLAAEKEE